MKIFSNVFNYVLDYLWFLLCGQTYIKECEARITKDAVLIHQIEGALCLTAAAAKDCHAINAEINLHCRAACSTILALIKARQFQIGDNLW